MARTLNERIRSLPLTRGEELRVAFEEYRSRSYLHIRRWYDADGDGHLRPGKGVSVTPEMIPWLRAAIGEAEARALEAGLLELEDYEVAGVDPPAELLEEAAQSV